MTKREAVIYGVAILSLAFSISLFSQCGENSEKKEGDNDGRDAIEEGEEKEGDETNGDDDDDDNNDAQEDDDDNDYDDAVDDDDDIVTDDDDNDTSTDDDDDDDDNDDAAEVKCGEGDGNELGVGKACAKGGGDCPSGLSCDLDLDPRGVGMCIKLFCQNDDACGSQASCCKPKDSPILICMPNACLPVECGGEPADDDDDTPDDDDDSVTPDTPGQCLQDSDCRTAVPECAVWVPGGFCGGCASDSECGDGSGLSYVCNVSGTCSKKCGSDSDCPFGLSCKIHGGDSLCGLNRCSTADKCPAPLACDCLPGAGVCDESSNKYCLVPKCGEEGACPDGYTCVEKYFGDKFCGRMNILQ
ncbi:MAG: hypothetical protein Kow0090_03780 [Myxococcota bacterium]